MKLLALPSTILVAAIAVSIMVSSSVAQSEVPTAVPGAGAGADAPNDSQQAANAVSVAWDASFASKYVFQGSDYSTGNAVFQPEVVLGLQNFSATVWFNHDLETSQVDEVDLYLKYGHSIGSVDVGGGYARFGYPHRDWDPSQEFFVDVSREARVATSLSVHYDFDAGQGAYSTLGLNTTLPTPVIGLAVATNLFRQERYYGMSGFPALEVKVGFEKALGAVAVSPSLSRFVTWQNGDFRGESAVPGTWLLSLNVAQSF